MNETENEELEQEAPEKAAKKGKKSKKLLFILIGAVAVAAVAVTVFFLFFTDSPEKRLQAAVTAMLQGDYTLAEEKLQDAEGDEAETARALLAVLVKNEECLQLDLVGAEDPAAIEKLNEMDALLAQLSSAAVVAVPKDAQQLITKLTASALTLHSAAGEVPVKFTVPLTEARGLATDWAAIKNGSKFTAGVQINRWRTWEAGAKGAREYYAALLGEGLGTKIADEVIAGLDYMAETLEMEIAAGSFEEISLIRYQGGDEGADKLCAQSYTDADLQRAEDQLILQIYQNEMAQYSRYAPQDGAESSAAAESEAA
ncbi:MAG: hypothetical protein Q4G07_02960 [Oscillospiraceae bacterium]|nr:hypothetical protein [Oscillospiraceae bacterium]